MEKPNVDDIFDDFEYKVEGKKEKHPHINVEDTDEEHMKRRFQKELDKQNKEREKHHKQRNKEIWKDTKPKNFKNFEKIAYMVVILVLAVYIGIDSYYHGKGDVGENGITTQAIDSGEEKVEEVEVVEEDEAVDEKLKDEVEEDDVEVKKKLSGKILIGFKKIYSEVDDADNDLGYITKVDFIIENGKDKNFTPLVNVYVYDDQLRVSYEQRSRGEYKGTVIESGESRNLSISISPKTFRNLDLEKNIRLNLNSTEEGYITAVNTKILIS